MRARICREGIIVVAQVLQGALLLDWTRVTDDSTFELLRARALEVAKPLMQAGSTKQLRRIADRAVRDYLPIKSLISVTLVLQPMIEGQTAPNLMRKMVGEVWEILNTQPRLSFSVFEKRTITDLLTMQAELAALAEEVPPENSNALYSAIIDFYWPLHKIDLCFFALGAIHFNELEPENSKIPHWLCLAIKGYLKEWQSALFTNDPVLQERLSRPIETLTRITTEELERRLGL